MRLLVIFGLVFPAYVDVSASSLVESADQQASASQALTPSEQAAWYAQEVAQNARDDPDYAIQVAEKAETFFLQHQIPAAKATVLSEKAYALYLSGRAQQAMTAAKKAERFALNHNATKQAMKAKAVQGHVLQGASEFDAALKMYQPVLQYAQQQSDTDTIASVTNSIANVYLASGRFDFAIDFYSRLSDIQNTLGNLARQHLGLGNSYSALKNYDKAEEHLLKAVSFYEQAGEKLGMEISLTALADMYYDSKKYPQAKEHFFQVLKSAENSGRNLRLANVYLGLAEIAIVEAHWKEVDEWLAKAENLKQTDNSVELGIWVVRERALEKQGRYKEAIAAFDKAYQILKDSTQAEMTAQLSMMHALMEVDAANSKVEMLDRENKLRALELQRNKILLVGGAALFVLIITLVSFWWYRKNKQQQLLTEQLKAKQLEEMDKFKDKVLANTSHELRTPLNGIIGLTEILSDNEQENLSEQGREQLELIKISGERLLYLVEDLIQISQLREKRMTIERESCDLAQVGRDVVQLLDPLASRKSLTIRCSIQQRLPRVNVDSKRMAQVLTNLLKNAIKYSDSGTITLTIDNPGSSILCKVSDQGPGIAADELERIFRPFERVNDKNNPYAEGAGLGLSIVKEILALHNIEIYVRSEVGRGTEFYFEIPTQNDNVISL